jgi:flagellar motor component MotA
MLPQPPIASNVIDNTHGAFTQLPPSPPPNIDDAKILKTAINIINGVKTKAEPKIEKVEIPIISSLQTITSTVTSNDNNNELKNILETALQLVKQSEPKTKEVIPPTVTSFPKVTSKDNNNTEAIDALKIAIDLVKHSEPPTLSTSIIQNIPIVITDQTLKQFEQKMKEFLSSNKKVSSDEYEQLIRGLLSSIEDMKQKGIPDLDPYKNTLNNLLNQHNDEKVLDIAMKLISPETKITNGDIGNTNMGALLNTFSSLLKFPPFLNILKSYDCFYTVL